jgi:hypothetical protein
MSGSHMTPLPHLTRQVSPEAAQQQYTATATTVQFELNQQQQDEAGTARLRRASVCASAGMLQLCVADGTAARHCRTAEVHPAAQLQKQAPAYPKYSNRVVKQSLQLYMTLWLIVFQCFSKQTGF